MKAQFLNKTKTIYRFFTVFAILMATVFFISCEKNEDVSTVDENSDIINESYASEMFDEVEDLGDEAVDFLDNTSTKSAFENDGIGNYNRLSPCAVVTRIYEEDSVFVTIDFGEENCLCNDGRERRGKIYINHYGSYWGDGETEIEFSFENYFVDDNQILGNKYVYRYINESQHRISEIISDGSIILAEEAGTISWHAERIREAIEGSETHYKYDDVIEITGTSNSTLADGTEITCEITTPLVRDNKEGCFRYIVSGVREIMKGEEVIIIDYGDGTCDNLAEITRDGVTEVIEIKRRPRLF